MTYNEVNEMLRSQVETKAIWTQNLNEVDDVTEWKLVEDHTTGHLSIERTRT
jgi:hypothetical protein